MAVDLRAWLLGDLALTNSRVSALRIERSADHIARDRRDTYSLILLKHGGWTAEIDSGCISVAAGQICIMDFAQGWLVEGTAQENVMLVVPRALVAELAPDAPALHGRFLEGASGRLLAEHMLALTRRLPATRAADAELVRRATTRLIEGALLELSAESHAPFRYLKRDIAGQVLRYIERQLTDRDLSVATICRDIAISRPTLYRAFRAGGGVSTYIQQRRLESAHARIADEGDRSSMAEIADRFCFSSPAHFSTAFRRRFGYTPTGARGAAAGVHDAAKVFETWQHVLGTIPVR